VYYQKFILFDDIESIQKHSTAGIIKNAISIWLLEGMVSSRSSSLLSNSLLALHYHHAIPYRGAAGDAANKPT
jgi:hypothetical protein